jgi:hypothetical protein
LKSMTRFIIGSCAGMIVFILGGIFSLIDDFFTHPIGFYVILWFFYAGLECMSISNISAFVVVRQPKMSKSDGEQNSQIITTKLADKSTGEFKTKEMDL